MNSMSADGVGKSHLASWLGWAFPRGSAGWMLGVGPEHSVPRYGSIVRHVRYWAWIPLKVFSKTQGSICPVA